jgi:thiol-disulfide isomerase/thioredoxin
MKKIFFFLATVCLFSACGPQANYTINGTVKGIEDGTTVFFGRFPSSTWNLEPIDSVTVQKGAFKFQGHAAPDAYVLTVSNVYAPFFFFITGNGETLDVALDANNMPHSRITGDAMNEQYNVYVNRKDSLDGVIEALMSTYTQKEEEINNKRVKDAEKKKLLDEAEKEVTAAYEALDAKQTELTKDFVLANANNIAGQRTFLIQPYVFNADELSALVAKMEDKESETAKVMQDRATRLKNVETGKPFVDVELNDVDDKPVKLSSVAGKGSYVLVDFWASWCGPCRRENPNVVALYRQYHDKGFDIVGISVDKDKEAWLKAIAEDGLTWTHLLNKDDAASKPYVIDFIPTTFLLDKEGKIMARGLRSDALRDKLKELLGE